MSSIKNLHLTHAPLILNPLKMNPVAKILIIAGLILIIAGLIYQFGGKFLPLGRLPGDIVVERENFRFYFPIVTSIILSILLSLLLFLFRFFSKPR